MLRVQRLKELLSLGAKNITRRTQRALEELRQELQNETLHPRTIPVRVGNSRSTLRRPGFRGSNAEFKRNFCNFGGFQSPFFESGYTGFNFNHHYQKKAHSKFFKFFKFYHHCSKARGSNFFYNSRGGFLFNNFSQRSQTSLRVKAVNQNARLTYLTLFNSNESHPKLIHKNYDFKPEKLHKTTGLMESFKLRVPILQLRKDILDFAKKESSATVSENIQSDHVIKGCFIEFPMNLDVGIPSETILDQQVLNELIQDLTSLLTKIEELKQDLTNLFELGELPIEYIASKNIIRVHFPNCDREKLETLCREKGVQGGIIYEAESEEYGTPVVSGDYDVGFDDILSSNLSRDLLSVSSRSSDILSTNSGVSPLTDSEIVRIETPELSRAFLEGSDVVISDLSYV